MRAQFDVLKFGDFVTVTGRLECREMSITTSQIDFCGEWTEDYLHQIKGTCQVCFGSIKGMKRELSRRLRGYNVGGCSASDSPVKSGCYGCSHEAECEELFPADIYA